jgi:hypothetical protein
MTVQYSLQDYINISFKGYDYKLPDNVSQTISSLIKELGINMTTTTRFDTKPAQFNKNATNIKRTKSGNKMSEEADEHWSRMREFKATIIDKKEGVEKNISDIRSCLNKISEKSYQAQLKEIQELIQQVLMCLPDIEEDSSEGDEIKNNRNDVEGAHKIANIIFDVASSNKMNSVLYANLYKELICLFPKFRTIIDSMIPNYLDSLRQLKYVNHENDYDAFCDYNKVNDKRKALVIFMVNLMNIEVLTKDGIRTTILTIQEMISNMITESEKVNEVDELTENLFLLVTMTKGDVLSNDKWRTIKDDVKNISGYKSKDYKSLSNRAIFKHMDIIDILKK